MYDDEEDLPLALAKKYPHLLMVSPVTGKPTEYTVCSQYPLGWFKIIEQLVQKVDALNLPSSIFFTQIKEKFGTLRSYTSYHTEELGQLITEAEQKSAVTCEVCGEPGRTRNLVWIATLCDTHIGPELELLEESEE